MNKIKGGDHVMIKESQGFYKVYDYDGELYVFLGPDKVSLNTLTIINNE